VVLDVEIKATKSKLLGKSNKQRK